jgi:acyl-CoA hydrolase
MPEMNAGRLRTEYAQVAARVHERGSKVNELGNSSARIGVEVWGRCPDGREPRKVTETECVQVAIDQDGHIRLLPAQ